MKIKIPKPRAKHVNDVLLSTKPGKHKNKKQKTRQELNLELKKQVKSNDK